MSPSVGDRERRLALLAVYGVLSGSHSGDLLGFPWTSGVEEILASFLRRLRIVGILSLSTMWVLTLSTMKVLTPEASCTLEMIIIAYTGSLGFLPVSV